MAENWRIRVGSTDRDTAQTVSLNLSLALKAQGKNVDYAIAWEQPHTGSYDNTDMFAWFESLSK